MSRWREMLMDYGQVFESSSQSHYSKNNSRYGGRANSAFSSKDMDFEERQNSEMQLRHTLETQFRPLFQRFVYGGEKLSCVDLRRLLRDDEYREMIPPEKVHELIDYANMNIGGTIRYGEFVKIVMGKSNVNDSTSFGSQTIMTDQMAPSGILSVVCRNTLPQEKLNTYLAKSYSGCPPPFFMISVVLAQIIAFIVYTTDDDVTQEPLEGIPQWNSNNSLIYFPYKRHEAWRYVSYWMVHQGYVDLICNVLLGLVVGVPLEIVFKWWRLAIVFTCGVIAGSLGNSVTDFYSGLAGSAGGTFAVVGGHLMAMWLNRNALREEKIKTQTDTFGSGLILRAVLILAVVISQIVLAVYRRWGLDDLFLEIGIGGHIFGLLAGFTLAKAFLTNNKGYPWDDHMFFYGLFNAMVFVGVSVVVNIAYDGYPEEIYD